MPNLPKCGGLIERLARRVIPPRYRLPFFFSALLVFYLVFGVLQTFLSPPFQTPDEPAHWNAVVVRAERMISKKNQVCSPLLGLPQWFQYERIKFQPQEKVHTGAFASSELVRDECVEQDLNYGSSLSYPGALLGYLFFGKAQRPIARILAFYSGRLFQGLLFLISLGFSVNTVLRAPSKLKILGLLTLFILALTPKAIQQSFSISSDGAVHAFAWTLASLVLCREIGNLELAWLGMIGFCAVSTKPILVPVILPVMIWVLARNHSAPLRRRLLSVGTFLTATGIYYGVSARAVTGIKGNVDQALKMSHLMTDPFKTVFMIFKSPWTYFRHLSWLLDSLGWVDFNSSYRTRVSFFLLGISGLLCVFLVIQNLKIDRTGMSASRSFRLGLATDLLFFAGLVTSVFLVSLILYLTWSSIDSPVVLGLQGRYFFPQLILIVAWIFGRWDATFSSRLNSDSFHSTHLTGWGFTIGLVSMGVFFSENVVYRALDLLVRYW